MTVEPSQLPMVRSPTRMAAAMPRLRGAQCRRRLGGTLRLPADRLLDLRRAFQHAGRTDLPAVDTGFARPMALMRCWLEGDHAELACQHVEVAVEREPICCPPKPREGTARRVVRGHGGAGATFSMRCMLSLRIAVTYITCAVSSG